MPSTPYIQLGSREGDAAAFLRCAEDVVAGALRTSRANALTVVRIDNWFDRKWLGFSGKGIVPFMNDRVALDAIRNDRTVAPPFNPNRIEDTSTFRWCPYNERFLSAPSPRGLRHRRPSSYNLHDRLDSRIDDHLVAWISGRTETNGKGSMLLAVVKDGETATGYVSFDGDGGWSARAAQGVPMTTIEEYARVGARIREERAKRVRTEEEVLADRLCAAAKDGRLVNVADLVGAEVELARHGPDGTPPLLVALENGHFEVAKYLLDAGADPYQRGLDGRSALHACLAAGDRSDARLEMLRRLVAAGHDVDARDSAGIGPLHFAAFMGDAEGAALLVELGAEVDARCDVRWTPLHEAALGGRRAIVEMLIANGARVGLRAKLRQTALMHAASKGHLECVRALLAAGSSPHTKAKNGRTALDLAKKNGHDAVAELLRRHG